jgi:hypothetical protein
LETVEEDQTPDKTENSERKTPVWELLLALLLTAGMVGWAAPRLLKAVSDSRLSAFSDFVIELRTGLSRYQADEGTLLPLDRSGAPVVHCPGGARDAWSLTWVLTRSIPPSAHGSWEKFQGPYLREDILETPPLGDGAAVVSGLAGSGSHLTPAPPSFDLTGTGTTSVANGHPVAWLVVTGVSREDFEALDTRLDWGIGAGQGQKRKIGSVLWSPDKGGTLLVHLVHG